MADVPKIEMMGDDNCAYAVPFYGIQRPMTIPYAHEYLHSQSLCVIAGIAQVATLRSMFSSRTWPLSARQFISCYLLGLGLNAEAVPPCFCLCQDLDAGVLHGLEKIACSSKLVRGISKLGEILDSSRSP